MYTYPIVNPYPVMDQYDTSQLTEFPRFEPESSQSGVSTFFNKLWKFPIFSPGEAGENKALTDGKVESPQSEDANKQDYEEKAEAAYAVEFEGRSLQNVLRRISSLVALGSSSGTKYSDTELARYWMPDEISRECYECAARFGTLRRRHHCRVCGQVFCSRCCCQRVPGHIFGCAGGLRVCTYCCRVVLSYLREHDAGDISPDLRSLQESLQVKFPEATGSTRLARERSMFAREEEARPREPPAELFAALCRALPTMQHRSLDLEEIWKQMSYRLVRYSGVWRGSDVMQWLVDNTAHNTRAQARCVCQALVSGGWLLAVPEPAPAHQFADYALYRPARPPHTDSDHADREEEHPRLVASVSSYCLDLDLGESSARLTKTPKPRPEPKPSPSSEEDTPCMENTEGGTEGPRLCPVIAAVGEEHLQLLMRQQLSAEGLAAGWLSVLYPLCVQAARTVMPDMHASDIDVRNYVQVKKLPDGAPSDSRVVPGVVLTKNVAHRGMPQEIDNPTVLLLDCSIAYQRVEGKLTSLEPMLLQEREYLVRCAARITALQPAAVLVGGAVARGVQDALRGAGVALATRVGQRALHRARRCLRADLVSSVDARIAVPRLDPSKTLMSLEGCAEPQLGCCILLRGAPVAELARVKRVVKLVLLACYNWKLESAFLADVEARMPAPGAFDDELADEDEPKDTADNDAKLLDDEEFHFDKDLQYMETNEEKDENTSEKKAVGNESENIGVEDKETSEVAGCDKVSEQEQAHVSSPPTSEDAQAARDHEDKFSDPLAVQAIPRRTEERQSCSVPIRDFSDPLRAPQEDDVFAPEDTLQADITADRWCTDDTVLSISPLVVVPAPYLETEAGRRCPLRKYCPRPLLRAHAPAPHTPRHSAAAAAGAAAAVAGGRDSVVEVQELHPFVARPITATADDPALRASLAHFRAVGCPGKDKHKPECPQHSPSVLKARAPAARAPPPAPAPAPPPAPPAPPAPLSPAHHQRLSVLLYSYSRQSSNVPDFCVNPWIVTMEMYGRHDITLGAFLDKYCFNSESRCPSASCTVPVNRHIRRFVHGDACITITCNVIGHSAVDKPKEQVMFWSQCEQCGAVSRARRLSPSALCVSLAVYLRARCAPARAVRLPACRHPLRALAHVFARRTAAARCRYMKITPYEIDLPPEVISTNYDTRAMRDALIAQLNELVLKGHETLSAVSDAGAEQDYQAFKHHTEQISLALTQAKPGGTTTTAGVVRSLWAVSDALIAGERMLRDAQDTWAGPAPRPTRQADAQVEEKSDLEESTGESENSAGTTYVFSEPPPPREDKDHTGGGEEDEERGDKKTVRQILSQLLSNREASHQNGIIISSGLVPVVVQVGEIGSVIAATLASVTYQRSLRAQRHSSQAEGEEAEGGRERTETDKGKAKSNDHIEVLLKDGLLCRVYYAPQFHRLRHALVGALEPAEPRVEDARCCDDVRDKDKSLCDIEEGFIRSLAQCVPWAAKGGKSGSTFCKTKDDRYVLKEMTKPEWQQFLEFAPHYFNYVSNCRTQQLPSLLARILGVYSVGGAGNGVLVMENVWYGREGARFDLKGSSRHRLAPPAPRQVLLDENLLQLRWEQQLFVASHTGLVLFSCVDRDTDFLAANSVMDYSLLLGIDCRRLVLGIIDYIRTFTWDKRLEHLVKKNLGSGQPTVVSPDEYKRRFCSAARKYFLRAPEPWDHLV